MLKRSHSESWSLGDSDELKGSRRGSGSARRSFFRRRRHQRNNSKDSREGSFSDASVNSESVPILDGECSFRASFLCCCVSDLPSTFDPCECHMDLCNQFVFVRLAGNAHKILEQTVSCLPCLQVPLFCTTFSELDLGWGMANPVGFIFTFQLIRMKFVLM